jgi:hypothetical protein
MSKTKRYREILSTPDEWDAFLLAESGLPGPRANLELVQAVADVGDEARFRRYLAFDAVQAPTNSAAEFLPVCGVVGLGRLLAEGHTGVLETIRACAADPRWRVREGVCMALQRLGQVDMDALLAEMEQWQYGNLLERRAAAAALCEPALLRDPAHARRVLQLLDNITASLSEVTDRKSDPFRVLRKGLGYCWSVAVAALPEEGKRYVERWFGSEDKDVCWIMKENLKKKRLVRVDAAWVARWQKQLS